MILWGPDRYSCDGEELPRLWCRGCWAEMHETCSEEPQCHACGRPIVGDGDWLHASDMRRIHAEAERAWADAERDGLIRGCGPRET